MSESKHRAGSQLCFGACVQKSAHPRLSDNRRRRQLLRLLPYCIVSSATQSVEMEAFLAFDPHNYPFLVDYNSRFVDIIARIAFKHGMVTCSSKEAARRMLTKPDNDELENILVLLFAPYVAGLRVLGEQSSSSNLLSQTVPSTRFAFAGYMDHVILHVTDSSTSCRSTKLGHRTVTSERSLFYFVELVKFAFGSDPMVARSDETQANLVRSLHRHWLSSHSSPVYLLEAMERLLVSANLKATLTLILQAVLSKCRDFLKLYGEVPSQALLYVSGKFTCEFSNHCSNRLSKKDLILLQLLVESKCLPKANRSSLASSKASACTSDGNDEDLSYFGDTESDLESSETSRSRRGSRNSDTLLLQSFAENMPQESVSSSASFLLFVEGSKDVAGLRLPFCVRAIKVSDTVVIMITSELTTRFLAKSIHSIISTLTKAANARHEFNGFGELHDFDKSCVHLKNILGRSVSRSAKQLIEQINQLIQADIRKYCSGFSKNELPIKIDALSSSVCSSLRAYYQEFVYQFEMKRMRKVSDMDQVIWHMLSIQSFSQEQIKLYIEYLEVKSKINMTIEPYNTILPGLKAFIFIDRKINTLVFAAADQKARDALPQAVAQCYTSLKSGKLSSSFLVNELSCHYFHWFESMRGNTMKPTEGHFVLNSFPCLIQNDFITEIISKSFPCKRRDSFCCWGRESVSSYEILVLCKASPSSHSHTGSFASASSSLSNAPINDIEVRCKRLASKLAEFIAPEHFVSTLF